MNTVNTVFHVYAESDVNFVPGSLFLSFDFQVESINALQENIFHSLTHQHTPHDFH